MPSGSPEDIRLTPAPDRRPPDAIGAALALARRGCSLLKAKRAAETAATGAALLRLEGVENRESLAAELAAAGLAVAFLSPPMSARGGSMAPVLKSLRARLGLSQEQFALQFGFELKTLQGWELGKGVDRGTASYLDTISRAPEAIMQIRNAG